jgi:putative ABC transport system substrate-binding protein
LGVTVARVEVRSPSDLAGALSGMLCEQPNGLLVVTDQATFSERTRIIDFAREHAIDAAYEFTEFEFKEFAFLGGLVSYGPSLDDIWRRAVHHIDKIFKDAKPADLL